MTSSGTVSRLSTRLRTLPLAWIALVLVVLLSAFVPKSPIQDAATFEPITEAALRQPVGYVLLAPVSDMLDTLTLMTVAQHVALLVTIIVLYAVWWLAAGRQTLANVAPARRALREAARLGVGAVLIVAVYAAMAMLPRPMATLETPVGVIAIDFHAHTRYSHDGRSGWTPEDVRHWHRDAGFGAVYITDHRTFEGAREGWKNNPALAGEGTSLLPGIEVVWAGEHVNVLDADRMYRGLLTPDLRDVDEAALGMTSMLAGTEPILIETLPGDLSKMHPASGPGTPGVRAIEIVDGSPRGLSQTRRERARIVHLADSLNLALVSGSDSHGWGYTASAWTLMYVPSWRSATAGQLSSGIPNVLRRGARGSTRVVERYIADTDAPFLVPFTVPLVAWGMLRSASPDEHVRWMLWIVASYAAWRLIRTRRKARTPKS